MSRAINVWGCRSILQYFLKEVRLHSFPAYPGTSNRPLTTLTTNPIDSQLSMGLVVKGLLELVELYGTAGAYTHKPTFHQYPNPFTFWFHIGYDPQHDDFALLMPTYWYIKFLSDPTQIPGNPQWTQLEAQCEQVEYSSC